MRTRHTVVGVLTLVGVLLPSGIAQADETHSGSHNGPNLSLISIGQVDDPLEDVLEHAAILGTTYVYD
ncbi:hypothetical protein ACF06X_05445 [Streptomyces sp. NPDC015346]|uniref:hypothetical protein n=1 Tax=Streptomyces sp. NPDC015346 TaxID=3364954 RepID=UPI0037025547